MPPLATDLRACCGYTELFQVSCQIPMVTELTGGSRPFLEEPEFRRSSLHANVCSPDRILESHSELANPSTRLIAGSIKSRPTRPGMPIRPRAGGADFTANPVHLNKLLSENLSLASLIQAKCYRLPASESAPDVARDFNLACPPYTLEQASLASEPKGIRTFSISNSGHVAQKRTYFMVAIFWLMCTVFGAFSCSLVQRRLVLQTIDNKLLICNLVVNKTSSGKTRKIIADNRRRKRTCASER
jgi:hypothetical protein